MSIDVGELSSRESADTEPAREGSELYAESVAKCAKAHGQSGARESAQSRNRRKLARKISDVDALSALQAIRSGNSSARQEAKKLGVSHTALNKRIAFLSDSSEDLDGFHPDDLDKAIIRASLATGLPGVLGRLSDILGWTRIEILEAVR